MKHWSDKHWLRLSGTIVLGLALIWVIGRPRGAVNGKWLMVSTPVVGNFTNGSGVAAAVSFCVKNVRSNGGGGEPSA
jgi:hypothetical protein